MQQLSRNVIMLTSFLHSIKCQVRAFVPQTASSIIVDPMSRQTKLSSSSSSENIQNCEIVSSMPAALPNPLRNTFYLLRHGQSTANVAGIISSSRSLMNSDKHGLTPVGVEQGQASATQLKDLVLATSKENEDMAKQIVFYSSPFARAKETAQACLDTFLEEHMGDMNDWEVSPSVELVDGLIERYFGQVDDIDINTYALVWPIDMLNVTNTKYDVESVAAVATRIRETILSIDSQHSNKHIVLTSHADVLQITQLYASGMEDVGVFSSYRFGNGEVRRMDRTVESLPEPAPLERPSEEYLKELLLFIPEAEE